MNADQELSGKQMLHGQLDEEGQHDEEEESFQVQIIYKVSCSGSLCQYSSSFINCSAINIY